VVELMQSWRTPSNEGHATRLDKYVRLANSWETVNPSSAPTWAN